MCLRAHLCVCVLRAVCETCLVVMRFMHVSAFAAESTIRELQQRVLILEEARATALVRSRGDETTPFRLPRGT